MKYFYFIRHGESVDNVEDVVQTLEGGLSQEGARQARTVAERFKYIPIEAIYTSKAQRAHETAREISTITGVACTENAHLHERVKPRRLAGLPKSGVEHQEYERLFLAHANDPQWKPEDGESFAELCERLKCGLQELSRTPHEHVLVVTHGTVLRLLLSLVITEMQPSIEVFTSLRRTFYTTHHTGISILTFDAAREEARESSWKVLTWNDIAHLGEE